MSLEKVVVSIEGMFCQNCVKKVQTAMEKRNCGAKVDLAAGTANLTYDPALVTPTQLIKAIEEQGFQAKLK